jgi:hypothetical protein
MPIGGRLIGVLAAWLVGWAAQYGLTLSETEVVAIMLAVYGAAHSIYRSWRAKNDKTSPINAESLPKGTL